MNTKISNDRRIKDIQEDFNQQFPYLRIEFYSKKHIDGERSSEEDIYDNELLLGDIRDNNIIGLLPLDGEMKVSKLENMAYQMFGLNIQVFRKSYNKWLQTWATDMWTIDEQNKRAKIIGDKASFNDFNFDD